MDRVYHRSLRPAALDTTLARQVAQTLGRLHGWFETMRSPAGYCGPVAHWWQSCLLYSGPMADWRYEGLVTGYLSLAAADEGGPWLEFAVAAGEDVIRAQLPDGCFANSSFEIGPIEGGTPHEAAADIALLELARALYERGDERWRRYFLAAERNIRSYLIGRLWNGEAFRDQAWNETLVANKNATTLEALLLYEELGGPSMDAYIAGCVAVIARAQARATGSAAGGTVHLGSGSHQLAIGIYTARCAAALVRLYEQRGERRALELARPMLPFLLSLIAEDGTLFGFYPNGRPIVCPTWVSPSGDLLRALLVLQPYAEVSAAAITALVRPLVRRQLPSGGLPTAYGLGRKGGSRRYQGLPDFRDVLPVVGWCDKTFRALALLAPSGPLPAAAPREAMVECVWKGRLCMYHETEDAIRLWGPPRTLLYHWEKGTTYPSAYRL